MADQPYGVVTIAGKQYLQRWQVVPFKQSITANGQVISPIKITLPNSYDFILKAFTRETLVSGAPATRRFLCRIGNTDGAIWYSQGGAGATTDRILDSLLFGDARFPYVPPVDLYFSKNGAINMEIEDVSQSQPYDIQFAFHGCFLIPV